MTEIQVSSLMDVWLLLYNRESNGEHNRQLYLLKSRGMAHSNQIREFLLTDHGVELKDVYVGPEGVLTGSLRVAQEAREQAAALVRQQEIERRQRELERKRQELESQIAAQRAQFEAEQEELKLLIAQEESAADRAGQNREEMARSRKADEPAETLSIRSRRTPSQGVRK